MTDLHQLVSAAQAGDLTAFGQLVIATQRMVYAACRRILRERAEALDATQETYLRAFRGLHRLTEPAAFLGYLRRIAVHCAEDVRRSRRATFVASYELPEVPILDENEQRWSDAQRLSLSRALLTLTREERLITDRFYHGGWSIARLAAEAQVPEPTMRKRLSRIRNRLREEMEMSEQRATAHEALPNDLSHRIVELLARPTLVQLPDHPVAKVVAALRTHFEDYREVETAEVIDLRAARARLECDPVYVPQSNVFNVDGERVLRYDLTLPILLQTAGSGVPLRAWSAGKVYRNELETNQHLASFHQFELLALDESAALDPFAFIGKVLGALDALLPGLPQRVESTKYPFCTRAWDIGVERDGQYVELLGCGVYQPDVVRLLGADPARHSALGLGLGLERLAMLSFGITDIRLMEAARV